MRKDELTIAAFESVIKVLEKEIKRLQKLNHDLMDRIMSGNFSDYKMFDQPVFKEAALEEALGDDYDQNNAGEIYEGDDNGK